MHPTARDSEVEKGGALETASCLVRIIPCFRVEGMMRYGAFVPLAAFTAQACSCERCEANARLLLGVLFCN